MASDLPSLDSATEYTIAIIAALPHERAAVEELLDEEHDDPKDFLKTQHDDNSYSWGKIGRHNVVIASLPGVYAKVSTAFTAKSLRASLPHIRMGIFVGIAAGVPQTDNNQDGKPPTDKLLLGDIVISDPDRGNGGVVQYDLYKDKEGSKKEMKGFLNGPPLALSAAVGAMKSRHERKAPAFETFLETYKKNPRMKDTYCFPGVDKDPLRVKTKSVRDSSTIHYGTIASGDVLLKNATTRQELVEWLNENSIEPLCFEMEAAGLMNAFPCLIIRGICDYGDKEKNDVWQRYAAAAAAACAKELLVNHVRPEEVQRMAKIGEVLVQVQRDISNVQSKVTENMTRSVLHARLQVADGATYNAYTRDNLGVCLEDTRTEILQRVSDWYKKPGGVHIYWLCGKAGTGKSTIARTVASTLDKEGLLGASFFFSRGGGDRAKATLFFPTIVQQLLDKVPSARVRVADALDEDSSLCSATPQVQGERLLLQPFAAVAERRARFIVIDALDECESVGSIDVMLGLLSQAAGELSLYTLVTSRPEHSVTYCFKQMRQERYYNFNLENVPADTTGHDLEKYLNHRLKRIQEEGEGIPSDWPGSETIRLLAALASPLFIFAATVCNHIAQRQPQARLKSLIDNKGGSLRSLDDMYSTILKQSLLEGNVQESETLRDFRDTVGSIVLLYAPLSAASLCSLVGLDPEAVAYILRDLHSVLSIPASHGPIEVLHQSFRDFLLDPQKAQNNPFHIAEIQTHARLAERCLHRLQQDRTLSEDICGIGKRGTTRLEVNSRRVEKAIPADVAYACCYWARHTVRGEKRLRDNEDVHRFLQHYLIQWLEASSWLGQAYDAIDCLVQLRSHVDDDGSVQISAFLDDALRFARANVYVIDLAPLQLYTSALYFTPTKSIVRNTFPHRAHDTFSLLPDVPEEWDAEVLTFGSSHQSHGLALSPDGKLAVAWSNGGMLQSWDASTGEEKRTIKVGASHKGTRTMAVTFVSDGSLLAFVLPNVLVQIRSPDQSERLLAGLEEDCHAAKFSPNGVLLATATVTAMGENPQTTVRVWDVKGGVERKRHVFDYHGGFTSIAINADGSSLAVAWIDRVEFWNLTKDELEWGFHRYSDSVAIETVAFSLDGTLLASGQENQVTLWDAATGTKRHEFRSHDWFNDLAPCPTDNDMLTLLLMGSTVQVRQVAGAGEERPSEGHTAMVTNVAFSPDGKLLASGSFDRTLRLWDPATGRQVAKTGHDAYVGKVAFSPGGGLVAYALFDQSFRVWDVVAREERHRFQSLRFGVDRVEFSPDGKTLRTDVGEFEITADDGPPSESPAPVPAGGLEYKEGDEDWVYYEGERILWLPSPYRAALTESSAVYGNTLVLGSLVGAVSFFATQQQLKTSSGTVDGDLD